MTRAPKQASWMVEDRPHRVTLASVIFWFALVGTMAFGWAVTTFDAAGRPSPASLPVLALSPAAFVMLAVWWHGVRGVATCSVGVAAGALLYASLAGSSSYTHLQWMTLAFGAVLAPAAAAALLRWAGADLARSPWRASGPVVVVVTVVTAVVVAAAGAASTVSLVALWGHPARDGWSAARSLALSDFATIVVVVPVAFVLRGARARRTRHGTGVTGVANRALDRAQLRSIIDDSPEGVLVLDALGRIESVNRGAAAIFGAAAHDLVGRSLLDVLPAPRGVEAKTHLADVLGSSGAAHALPAASAVLPDAHSADGDDPLDVAVARVDVAGRWGYVATVRSRDLRPVRDDAPRSMQDPLTRLPNRALFKDRLARAVDLLQHRPGELALFVIEVGREEVDRTSGHRAGDELFVEVARRLRFQTREEDTVARIAEHRFAVICRSEGASGSADALAARLSRSLAGHYESVPTGIDVPVHVGVAIAADGQVPALSLLRDAKSALARAKRRGAGSWCVQAVVPDGSGLSIDLRDPLDEDQVVVRYQPILDLATGHVVAVEALVWLRGLDGSLLDPAQVMPADGGELPRQLGELVLVHALRDLSSLHAEEGHENLRVAVDVSPHLLGRDFVEMVRATLSALQLEPCVLCVEITETAPIDTMVDQLAVLRQMRALGVAVALDDFGTGFTRLDLIHDLPIDAVKIAGSFVRRMVEDTVDHDTVETIVGLARRRGLTVVADGVETVEQVHELSRLGCSQGQGPLFGQPVDVEELRLLLREWQIVPAIATAIVRDR